MTGDLSKQLHALQKSTDDLNALTDRANEIVRRVEVFLREKCRVGGQASVAVDSLTQDHSHDGGPIIEPYLDYERYKGDFRILVSTFIDNELHDSKPWSECSREVKLKALDALPELIGKLHEMVNSQLQETRAKIDHLDSMFPSAAELQQRASASKKG